MPIAISVNMLRLRVTSDCQPRTKNGQPAHSTTGVAKRELHPVRQRRLDPDRAQPARCAPISSTKTGSVSDQADPEPPRHVGEFGIGSGCRPSTISGSSAMPQIGQEPGPTCRISGCIGQV